MNACINFKEFISYFYEYVWVSFRSQILTYFGIWHQKPDNNALMCTHKHRTDDEFYFLFAAMCLISLQSNARKKASWENSDSKQAEYLI